jgi:hypothetical protein
MKNIYTPPVLDGHKILYKGKRYWVFEVDEEYPFEGYEKDCRYLIFDKSYGGCVISWCERDDDGSFKGYIQYGQGFIEVEGKTPKELIQSVVKSFKWIERTEK